MAENEVTYDNYLKIPKLLDCQHPKSGVREEVLFILTHQAFELWFKQILLDVDFLCDTLQKPKPEKDIRLMVRAAERIVKIFKLVTQQFAVLETMAPMEFMDFRDMLRPASGFQSLQFRLIEIKLGVAEGNRIKNNDKPYTEQFSEEAKRKMQAALAQPTLLQLVERWMERTPGLDENFVEDMRKQVQAWQDSRKTTNKKEDEEKQKVKEHFETLLDPVKYEKEKEQNASPEAEAWQQQAGEKVDHLPRESYEVAAKSPPGQPSPKGKRKRRISRKAFLGALMTCLYREEPFFNQNYTLLKLLMDIEEAVWMWRSNHVMMVHRMIGNKVGTGGSSGVGYLRDTVTGDRYRVFIDLFDVSTFLVPTKYTPTLTEAFKNSLAFVRDQDEAVMSRAVGAMAIQK